MDKLNISFTRPVCTVLDLLFENYTNGFFNYILNYTFGKDGLNKKSEEACNKIEEAVSEFEDGIHAYLSDSNGGYYCDFCMDIDKWDRVVVFLRNLNFHTVALLASAGHQCVIPFPVVYEYLELVKVAYKRIIDEREQHR